MRRGVQAGGGTLMTGALRWGMPRVGVVRAPGVDPLASMRAELGSIPIARTKLSDGLTLLSGPGGNVVALSGPDGTIVVDGFVEPAWKQLERTLDSLGGGRITALVDTHWHFDHADNNQHFRRAGAAIVAHENTKKRLTETHELLGMSFPPAPADALPTQTFKTTRTLEANGERIVAGYIPPAHTDTDIYVHLTHANVLHLGDVFFNGIYPIIDADTGGSIDGMIRGMNLALKIADSRTTIVPGHGPLGDKAALSDARDMLVIVRDRVQTLKAAGRTLAEVLAAQPTADLDARWDQGVMPPDNLVAVVFRTLRER